MNLRNRLIWIAALSVAFATVQWVASQRKAEKELVELLKDALVPIVDACVEKSPATGMLTLEVGVAPGGKLATLIEGVDVPASSEVQVPQLTECIRERARDTKLKLPLVRSPEQVVLELPLAH